MTYSKYDIVIADLNPRKGHVQSWERPCLVVSSDLFNPFSPTLVVVPITSVIKKIFPSEFLLTPTRENWLTLESRVLLVQPITLDVKYITRKLGVLDRDYYAQVIQGLSLVFDLG